MGELAFGRYRLEGTIGQGGAGLVHAATDSRTGERVALKILRPEHLLKGTSVARLRREAEALARIDHPNIVRVRELVVEDGSAGIVMDLLEGETFGARIAREAGVSAALAAFVGAEVSAGLAAGHDAGLVHRDVKPDNIFLVGDTGAARPTVKLLDFGVVKAPKEEGPRLTATNAVLGTWQYMPPEQAHGRPLDGRADVYALGAALYYALAKKRPYQAADTEASMFALSEAPAPPLASIARVDAALGRIVDRAIAKSPDARWPSARAFRDALVGWLATHAAGSSVTLRAAGPFEAPPDDATLASAMPIFDAPSAADAPSLAPQVLGRRARFRVAVGVAIACFVIAFAAGRLLLFR